LHPRVEATLEEITRFSKAREDIKAAFVVGSQARPIRPADEWSDLDVVFITTKPDSYLESGAWLGELGSIVPEITFVEGTAVANQLERRVLFDNGVDVDFAIFPAAAFVHVLGGASPSEEILSVPRRGIRILKDTENLVPSEFKHAEANPAEPPAASPVERRQVSAQEYTQALSDFLYHYVWAARKLRRGELFVAKACCDGHMKRLLLRMIEWYMRAEKGGDYDTWHEGRFIEKWADGWILEGLGAAYARYDPSEVASALHSTFDLYAKMARDLAAKLGFPYPARKEAFARKQVALALGGKRA
jgi:aminoglycoside 6-adenylyltransferase